jgi:hypothetical protein
MPATNRKTSHFLTFKEMLLLLIINVLFQEAKLKFKGERNMIVSFGFSIDILCCRSTFSREFFYFILSPGTN